MPEMGQLLADTARARKRRHKAALVPWMVNAIETHRRAAHVSRATARLRFAAALSDALAEHEQLRMCANTALKGANGAPAE